MIRRSLIKRIGILRTLVFIVALEAGCVNDQQIREYREAAEAAM